MLSAVRDDGGYAGGIFDGGGCCEGSGGWTARDNDTALGGGGSMDG